MTPNNNAPAARPQVLKDLTSAPLDLLVVGGGIVGSGVARDAAMRGLRVAIIDKHDFAFGTSSRSSRLLHGGLRYLAQGRVGLVHEASVEKVTIHKIAPHLAAPLPFIFPTRRGTEWKRWKLSIGVKIYDLLCHGRNLGKSTSLNKSKTLSLLPNLNPTNLTGAVRYYDGLTNDARLVLDTLRSAAANGALCANYVSLESSIAPSFSAGPTDRLSSPPDNLWTCTLVDHVTGNRFTVQTKTVINASGAWADKFPASQVKLRLTKGVHLVIDRTRLPIPDAIVMAEGSRILFAIPWADRVILGTTDTDYKGAIERPDVAQDDIDYILKVTNDSFPSSKLTQADVISAWSGLRPLIADPNGKPSDISRAHQILMPQPGWIDVAGGKLTTYRLMAEQTVDLAIKHANLSAKPCSTATTPLLPETKPQFSAIAPPPVSTDAVTHYVRNEWCMHLDDLMIRRTSWRYYHRDHLNIARQAATHMAQLLNWPPAKVDEELRRYESALSYNPTPFPAKSSAFSHTPAPVPVA